MLLLYEMLPGGPILIIEYILHKNIQNYFQTFTNYNFNNILLQG